MLKNLTIDTELRGRIKTVISENKVSILRLANGNAADQNRLNKQINGTTSISADTMVYVLRYFENLSAEWLLMGKGDMYVGEQKSVTITNVHAHDHSNAAGGALNIEDNKELVAAYKQQIEDLKKDKESLLQLLKNITSK